MKIIKKIQYWILSGVISFKCQLGQVLSLTFVSFRTVNKTLYDWIVTHHSPASTDENHSKNAPSHFFPFNVQDSMTNTQTAQNSFYGTKTHPKGMLVATLCANLRLGMKSGAKAYHLQITWSTTTWDISFKKY